MAVSAVQAQPRAAAQERLSFTIDLAQSRSLRRRLEKIAECAETSGCELFCSDFRADKGVRPKKPEPNPGSAASLRSMSGERKYSHGDGHRTSQNGARPLREGASIAKSVYKAKVQEVGRR